MTRWPRGRSGIGERDEEASPEEGTAKSLKRKKVVQDQEDEPPAKTRKEEAKTISKASSKAKKPPSRAKAAQAAYVQSFFWYKHGS